MVISIIQPSFFPWLGYIEQIARSDIFVYLDDVQYTRKDWRSRNKLKSPSGEKIVSVPVVKTQRDSTLMNGAVISYNDPWQDAILNKLREWYKKAAYFSDVYPGLENAIKKEHRLLVELIYETNNWIFEYLGIRPEIKYSSQIPIVGGDKNSRIIKICKHHQADVLYDGKAAESFIDKEEFKKNGINVIFQNYEHRPYKQLWGEFIPFLSVVDLLMNCGKDSLEIILASPKPDLS